MKDIDIMLFGFNAATVPADPLNDEGSTDPHNPDIQPIRHPDIPDHTNPDVPKQDEYIDLPDPRREPKREEEVLS